VWIRRADLCAWKFEANVKNKNKIHGEEQQVGTGDRHCGELSIGRPPRIAYW